MTLKKKLVFLYLVALVAGLSGFSRGVKQATPLPSPSTATSPSPTPSPTPLPTAVVGTHPRLVLTGTVNATPSEIKRIQDATNDTNRKLAASCFKEKVLKNKWDNTNGLTGAQIYALMSKEPAKLTVEIFNGNWRENYWYHTVAYEGTGAQIRLNRYFLGDSTSIGATEVHERLGHALGFAHPRGIGTGVPYGAQRAIEECP